MQRSAPGAQPGAERAMEFDWPVVPARVEAAYREALAAWARRVDVARTPAAEAGSEVSAPAG
jgi:hypothetical protein